jgi:hypothetical protein
VTWEEIPDKSVLRSCKYSLISGLAVVKVDSFGTGTPMYVAEDVETRLDAPDFAKQMRAAEREIEMGLGRGVGDENIGGRMDAAVPWLGRIGVLKAV